MADIRAVYNQIAAAGIAGAIGGQVDDRPYEFFGGSHTIGRDEGHPGVFEFPGGVHAPNEKVPSPALQFQIPAPGLFDRVIGKVGDFHSRYLPAVSQAD